ncbi:MAG TPA: 4Fe-4S dicluster domain-containing protein [Armatimonadota bacterium]|jgi:heterodisulfide reductase subunit C
MAVTAAEDRMIVTDDRGFRNEIESLSGQKIFSCYQCGECTGGCPVAYTADITPNQVIRMVQLGQEDQALNSSMIWLCLGCETCGTRCPKGVELSKVMDALRETAVQRGIPAKESAIKTFHETFLTSVERMGRTHEISMLGEYKLRTLNLFSDLFLGAKLFMKGKLAIVPSLVKGRDEMKKIFSTRKRTH